MVSCVMDVEEFKKKSPLQLSEFLQGKGIPLDVCDAVEDQEVDGETFLDLKEDDIKQLTKKLGLIKKLIRIIEEVKPLLAPFSPPFSPPTPTLSLRSPSPTPSDVSSVPSSAQSLLVKSSLSVPSGFKIPSLWRPNIMTVMEEDDEILRRQQLTTDVKSEIVRDLVTQMFSFSRRPSKDFCTGVAKMFTQKYPFTQDMGRNVSGYATWEKKIIDRVANVLNHDKAKKRPADDDGGAPTPKRGRSRVNTTLLRYPNLAHKDEQDDLTYQKHEQAIGKELSRENKRKDVLLPLLKLTFNRRRQHILSTSDPVSSTINKFPFFSLPFALEYEMELILDKSNVVKSAVNDWRTEWVPAIKKYSETAPKKAAKALLDEAKDLDEEGEERLSFKLLCAALLKKGCMPYIFEEVPVTDEVEHVARRDPPRPDPRIVCFGRNSYFIIIENNILCQLSSVATAIMVWFASHYVFHLEYCKHSKEVAIFLQELVFKLTDSQAKKTVTYLSVCTGIQAFIESD